MIDLDFKRSIFPYLDFWRLIFYDRFLFWLIWHHDLNFDIIIIDDHLSNVCWLVFLAGRLGEFFARWLILPLDNWLILTEHLPSKDVSGDEHYYYWWCTVAGFIKQIFYCLHFVANFAFLEDDFLASFLMTGAWIINLKLINNPKSCNRYKW